MYIIDSGGGDFPFKEADEINANFAEIDDRLLGWEDLRFPAATINPSGLTGPADRELTGVFAGALLFSATATEICVGQAQFPHAKKLDTLIYPHVHWTPTTTGSGNVLWRLEYIMAAPGGVFPGSYTVLDVLGEASLIAGMHLMAEFDPIDTTGYPASTMMCWKLSRIGGDGTDTYGADARLLEFDIHYQADEIGSTFITGKEEEEGN